MIFLEEALSFAEKLFVSQSFLHRKGCNEKTSGTGMFEKMLLENRQNGIY